MIVKAPAIWLILSVCAAPALVLAQEKDASTGDDETRFRLLVNGSYHASATSFSDATTFTQFLEQASSNRSYEGQTGFVLELGGIYSIVPSFGVMGSFELFDGNNDATFEEIVPHPLFFNRARSVEGSVSSLSYKEKALHLDAVYTRDAAKLTVDLFGGASFFFTETELLTDITTSSSYPFDELVLDGTSSAKFKDNPLGFNVGGALTFRLSHHFGIAFQARYSRATVSLERDGSDPIDLDAGGFRVGGGIRLAF